MTKEWKAKRSEIIIRDTNTCQICSSEGFHDYKPKAIYKKSSKTDVIFVPINYEEKEVLKKINHHGDIIEHYELKMIPEEVTDPVFLHVHHKYYILSLLPWEYPDESLLTVCSKCHEEIHKYEKIQVFLNRYGVEEQDLTPCLRCNGQGYFPQFAHIDNGICFRCGGIMYEELLS